MPKLITNYHTHSTFCDGHDSIEEMAWAAFKAGVKILGFSSHCMYPFTTTGNLSIQDMKTYCSEVKRMSDLYEGKMDVLLGFEADYIPGISIPKMEAYKEFKPDYLIGSVHFAGNSEGIFGVDDTIEKVKEGLQNRYNSDGKTLVCEYFSLQREMLKKGDFLIWGHPDVIRKRNGVLHFFDENDSWYKNELKETAKVAAKANVIAEINTGAISRKAMDDVYPSAEFLSLLHENKVPITFSSDAHNKEFVTGYFDRASEAAKKAGYTEIMYLNKKGQTLSQPL